MELSVYVGTYAKYNNGSLAGEWIDLEIYSDEDSFYEKCAEVHDDEDDPEYMIQDKSMEYFSECVSECGIDDELWEILDETGGDEDHIAMISDYISYFGESSDWRDAEDKCIVSGIYSERDYHDHLVDMFLQGYSEDQLNGLRCYLNEDQIAHDMDMDYAYEGTHVFTLH